MNIFEAVSNSSKTMCSVCRIARATLRDIASVNRMRRHFPCTTFLRGASVVALILIFSGYRAFGIEGLTISIQNRTNVVLGWPSATNETYLIQSRPSLDANHPWQALTDYYPAFASTNRTTYTITNAIPAPSGGGSGSEIETNSPLSSDIEISDTAITTNGSAFELAPGDSTVPPSPWILASLPNGAILKASGEYFPLPPVFSASRQATGNFASQDDDTNSAAPDPGFYEVVRDGAHIYGLTNGAVVSGNVQFSIELGLEETDQIVGITFYDENNSSIIGATAQGAGNKWTFHWNTPQAFNGTCTIYAEVDFASNGPVVGFPVTVTVSNVISFPNYLAQSYGDWMWIYAQTIPNANYEIDMYDENTNYLGYFFDSSDGNGNVSFLWDLTDGNGHTFDSTNFSGVFTVDTSSLSSMSSSLTSMSVGANSPNFSASSLPRKTLGGSIKANGAQPDGGSSSSASANQFWVKEPPWTPNNKWVVAYGLISAAQSQNQQDTWMIAGGSGGGEYGGVLGTLDPDGLNGNLSPGNNCQAGTVYTVSDQPSATNLLEYLSGYSGTYYRNFYFFGHGNASSIGAYNGAGLTQEQIALALLNVPLNYQIQHAALWPYRFVFIDACNAGKGNFCEAFGIPAMTLSTNYFLAASLESRAFVGFKNWSLNFNFWSWQSYSLMTGWFLSDWERSVPVQTCVSNAQNDTHQSGQSMNSSAVVYGAADLQFGTRTRP